MPGIKAFFREIDGLWESAEQPIVLGIIGSSALMLQADYQRGTKDSDVLESDALPPATKKRLLTLAGEGTAIHQKHNLYIDFVPPGLPFLPQTREWITLESVNATLRHLQLRVLSVVDVVVSKLIRLNANDFSDIEAMVDKGLVKHEQLVSRFERAIDAFQMDARAEQFPEYVKNLNQVERDLLFVPESDIELPSWI